MRFPALSAGSLAVPAAAFLLTVAALFPAGCHRPDKGRRDMAGGGGAAAQAPDALISPVAASPGTHIALLYSSNLQGEFEPCSCPSLPLGGLARRATVFDRARAEADGVLAVDAGDLLLPLAFHADGPHLPEPGEVERRARLLLESYARLGVAAILPAERDLGIGVLALRRLSKAARVPMVASNLVDRQGQPLFERDRIVTVAGVPIGIFGVVRPLDEDRGAWERWGVTATDPTEAARAEIASLKKRGARMIVALLHLGPANAARELLKAAPGITWAVQGHAGMQFETPETIGGARLLEAMSLGKLVGRLDIHVVGGQTASFSDRGERAQMLTILADHRRQLVDLEKRADEDTTDQLREFYKLRREGLTKAVARDIELSQRLPLVIAGSWFENRIIPLDESIADHPGTALLVRAYTDQNARRAARGLPVGLEARAPNAPVAHPPPPVTSAPAPRTLYAGSVACAGCHAPAWKAFQTTKHARALAALKPARRDRDPTCVGCHATGFGLPGGTTDIHLATTRLRDVGCESCHGPGLDHLTATDRKGTIQRSPAETVCLGCHTPDRTNGAWDFERFRQALLVAGHGRT
jgi:hypothetical protein